MVVTNSEVAGRLRELARLTTLEEGNSNAFRVRAYETAARTVAGLAEPVAGLAVKELTALRGIGSSTARKIRELVETGTIARLEELRVRFPRDFVDLTRIPGIGPKTAVKLRHALGITNVAQLEAALEAGALRDLPGLGEKTESNLKVAIERLGLGGKEQRTPILDAMRLADEVVSSLRQGPGVTRAEPMGSLRRFRETIGDLDVIVVSTGDPEEVMRRFTSLPVVDRVVGYGARKSAIVSHTGMQIDVRVVEPAQFGSAALYFTGSKAHNIRLRQMAIDRGWILNEYALSEAEGGAVVARETEEEVYAALGLPWIPPEIREDDGEIEAALGDGLPRLVSDGDLRGDLHVHTDLSGDGRQSLEEMVVAAAARGYRYLAITDHGEDLAINGVSRRRMLAQRQALVALAARHPKMTLLHGVELNIGPDGSVDYDPEFLAGFDFGVASVHSHFDLDRRRQTRRIVTAMAHPAVNVIGHLTGRRIGRRPVIDLDVEAVLAAAEETGCALEVNGHLDRLDAPADILRQAGSGEAVFVASSDAHDAAELDQVGWAVRQSRRGWVAAHRVANTWGPKRFLDWVRRKRVR